jgi:hypothetical protein
MSAIHHDTPTKAKPNPTQADEILAALQAGDRLTQLDASIRFGVGRLGARIHDLRKDYPIESELIEVKKPSGKSAYVARYYLAGL